MTGYLPLISKDDGVRYVSSIPIKDKKKTSIYHTTLIYDFLYLILRFFRSLDAGDGSEKSSTFDTR